MNERWVEAEMSPTDQAKCDLLGIRVMVYKGITWNIARLPMKYAYSVRKIRSYAEVYHHDQINNLCTIRADGTLEVAIFRSVESAIRGATSKENTFLK